ncbi:MAG: sigma-70 family RNA polymerase sigma factor [Candidatus Kapabacteria bacterium]|nr:sigma-70 family RNA polymerase sigma factor [Candidatus Kapabacteria bacterium]
MPAEPDWKRKVQELHHEGYMWSLSCCHYDKELAKDVLQTVYLKIYDGKASFHDQSQLKTWFFSVIKFTSIDFLRRKNVPSVEPLHELHEHIPESESVSDPMRESLFIRLLQSLSAQQREVLTLAFYHDLRLEEISSLMHISIGSVRTHYERGKENFKKLLIKNNLDAELL